MHFKIHKEGWVYFIFFIILTFILIPFYPFVSFIFLFISLYIYYFFRDPERSIPIDDIIISPADGIITSISNSKNYDFLVSIDPNQQIAKKLNGQIMPNLILINQDGTIKWRHQGYMPGEEKEIKEQIEILLASISKD